MNEVGLFAMSRHEARQKLAREFGATDIVSDRSGQGVARIKELTKGVGADSVLECVGTAESMEQAIRATRPGGYVGYVGVPHGVQLDGQDSFFRHVHLHGGPAPVRRYLPRFIELIVAWRYAAPFPSGRLAPGYVPVVARAKAVEKGASLSVRDDGSLRLVAVADSHSAPHPATTQHIRSLCPDAILHAGDIGDLAVLDRLEAIAPLFAIRGNIDGRATSLPDVLALDIVRGPALLLRILMMHIAVDGPRLRADAARLARARDASLVVCGHSHVPLIASDGELSVFNPGSVGPRRFRLPIVFGTIDVTPSAVRLAHVDCETGLPWTPN